MNHTCTLCLNMIVKNEARILERLFDSVVSIIDCYCICDTGSTDNTIEFIESYFKAKQIPGKIVQEPFKHFSHNRNVALQSCVGMSDYVLLLDADMVLKVNQFDKSMLLKGHQFNVLQGNDSFYYQNTRIVQNNGLYVYCGVTHEYINTPENTVTISFGKNELFIEDIGDGGSKGDKFERDIRLFTDDLKENPHNVRTHFYLANSYADSKKYVEAIDMYKKRIEFGGWKQEVWYSYYKIGKCYQDLNQFSDALYYWLEGFNYYPDRLEGLYEIIKHYRLTSKHTLALKFYYMAKEILDDPTKQNRDEYLFLHNHVYTHSIYYEYLIIAYYNGIKNIDRELVTYLNHASDVDNIMSNIKFYKQILNDKCASSVLDLSNSVEAQINNETILVRSSSSCLIKDTIGPIKDTVGYRANIRYVNYVIDTNNGSYHNCEKHIITLNKYVELDSQLNLIAGSEKWAPTNFDGRLYIGVEDVKIYKDMQHHELLFIGTGYHQKKQIGIVSGKYNQMESADIQELTASFSNHSCEKNWVFVDYKNETHIIYDWNPMRICKLDPDTSVINVVDTKPMPKLFSRVRGSSCGFVHTISSMQDSASDDVISISISTKEIWFVNHLVSYETPRHYYHMISVFDSNMNLLRYSAPFKFEGEPIEYCLSIVVEAERVLMNYSVWDRTTKIGIYDKKKIERLLVYV